MSETKDQTIARLEGELKEANSEVERYRGNYRASQQELAASREKMDCGHPKACFELVEDGLHGNYICTLCAELAASRADAYERAAELCLTQGRESQCSSFACHATDGLEIHKLITPTDAAARDELLIRCKSCGGTLRYKRTQEGYEVYHDCIYGERGTAPRNILGGKPNA